MKVLFFYPNDYLNIGIPQGIAILSAILKKEGHQVELFDTTFVKTKALEEKHGNSGIQIFKKTTYTLEDLVGNDPILNMVETFQQKIDHVQPDLIAVSTMSTNFDYAMSIINKIKRKCPFIVGGVHATICPEDVIRKKNVDMICVGEGEASIAELCKAIEQHRDYSNVKNLWIKQKNGTIIKNELRAFADLNSLPCPDWSLFDPRHLFRPYLGEIYNGSFYISSRGCPCKCTYCLNESMQGIFKNCGTYFRTQTPEKTYADLNELKTRFNATWFKFGDDTFLLQSLRNLEKLCEMIKPLNIKFGCSIRPDTITEEKVRLVKEMGCVAMSVGIETGNENIRRKILNRQISNDQLEQAFSIINAYGIRISSFNLIGLPGETRENVFETIELNRMLNVKSANAYILYPFPQTQISRTSKVNCFCRNGNLIPMNKASLFHLSSMSSKEVDGLLKTFNLYLNLPKELWPIIKLAEKDGKQSQIIFDALCKLV